MEDKKEAKVVSRNFNFAPSKDKKTEITQSLKDVLSENSKKLQKRIQSLYEKNKISYEKLNEANNLIERNDYCCATMISFLEDYQFESQIQFENTLKEYRKTIFTLRTELMQVLKQELGITSTDTFSV